MQNFFQKILLKKGLILCLLTFCATAVSALHIKGGWMYYEYTGEGSVGAKYNVIIKVYRDCNPPNPGQNDAQISVTFFNNVDRSLYTNMNAPLIRQYPLDKTNFNDCINPKPRVCYVVLEYRGTVELPHNTEGYTAAFQRCCRISGIVNVAPPSNSLGNTYTIQFPGTKFNTDYVKNNSPVFSEKDTVVVCYSSDFELDYSAVDADGDSLSYSLSYALDGASQSLPNPAISQPPPYGSLTYSSGFSASNPFGSNISIGSKTGIIKGISPSRSGEYVLAVLVKEYRNGFLIAETRKELHVNVAPCSLVAAKLPETLINCSSFSASFENESTSPAINSYYWDFGVSTLTTDTSSLPTPTYVYADTGIYKVKLLVNRFSTCADSAFMEVRIFPGFSPGFTTDGACFSNPFLFTDTTKSTYGTVNYWRWDFGNTNASNDSSRLPTASYRYPTPGNYSITLEVGNTKGCRDTVISNLLVSDKPSLKLPFRDTLICSIDSLMLRAIGTGNFSWLPNSRIINANTATPTVFPLKTTVYSVLLNDRGCLATDSVRVNVLDFIAVNAGPDTTICRTDGVVLKPISQGLSFLWSPSVTLNNARLKNPIASPVSNQTTYTVIANLGKCQATDSVIIKTIPYPTVNAGPDTTICYGSAALLQGSTNGSGWQWTPTALIQNSRQLFTRANTLQTTVFTLTATDTLGCPKPATDQVVVTVLPRVLVNAGRDTTMVIGQSLQLNAITNGTIYRWTPPLGLSNTNLANPVVTLGPDVLPTGQDQIKYFLTASTSAGCSATDDIIVKIFRTGPSIFVPSAFTPNSDGLNDVIKPILAGIRQLDYFRIYNRYGQIVFETKQIGSGWNGNIAGNNQGTNAFVYHCQAVDYLGKTITQSGTFVLIK